jgi:hypothetical protein
VLGIAANLASECGRIGLDQLAVVDRRETQSDGDNGGRKNL